MSFVLPRNIARLTFSGSFKPLGQPRGRAASSPSEPSSGPDPYAGESIRTPYMGSAVHLPALRGRMDSVDDEIATVALHRADFARAQAAVAAPKKPLRVFEFQQAAAAAGPLLVPLPRKPSARRSPLVAVAWLMASLLAAMGSYKYAPEIVDQVHAAARALSSP